MGKLVRKGKRHCIMNTHNKKIGRCFSKRSKAKSELSKAIKRAKARR